MADALVTEALQRLRYYRRVLTDALADHRDVSEGERVTYSLDFSLLFLQCFDPSSVPEGSNDPLWETEQSVRKLLAMAPAPEASLAVTAPTVLEFQDSLAHRMAQAQRPIEGLPSLRELRERTADGSDWFADASFARQRSALESLLPNQIDRRVRLPVRRFLGLFETGVLVPVEDCVTIPASLVRRESDLYEAFVEQHFARRFPSERRRSRADARFHYRIDAANSLITRVVAEVGGSRLLFVTPTPLNWQQCQTGSLACGRSELVPLALFETMRLDRAGVLGSAKNFLERAMSEALELVDEFRDLEERGLPAPEETLLRYTLFLRSKVLMATGLHAGGSAQRTGGIPTRAELEELIASPSLLQQRHEELVESLKAGAAEVDGLLQGLPDIPYLEHFDFADDHVVTRARNLLGLSALPRQ